MVRPSRSAPRSRRRSTSPSTDSVDLVSRDDPRLTPFTGMYAAGERGDDICIVEGRLSVETLLDSPYRPISLLIAERLADDPLVDVFPGDVLVASQDVIDD